MHSTYEVRYGHVIRTEHSRQMKDRRDVLKADTTRYTRTAQEVADERHLSRSKEYPNKGRKESERRREQISKTLWLATAA